MPSKGSLLRAPFLAFIVSLMPAVAAPAANRPNILFIMADDHAWQAVSAYGDSRKLNQTPNIDRIGKQGMRFDRCMVCNALCGPSRACILTGTYNHINGFYNNGNCRFDGSQITYPKLLQAAGYQTAVVGKWHLETDPTGFDYWNILPGQGVYYNPVLIDRGQKIKHPGYVTDIITDLSLDWLKQRDPSKPFMLLCWHKAPHRIWEPALRDLDFDRDRVYSKPDNLFDDYNGRGLAERDQNMTISNTMRLNEDSKLTDPTDITPGQRAVWDAYYQPRNKEFLEANLTGKALTEWKYNRFMHDYLACIKGVDDGVGRLLQYLDDTGLASNTIVIYSSDQGFFLGEHGWFDKRWIFDESARTPLLVRWPGVIAPGSSTKALVSNLDLAETFLDAAGLPTPGRMQGHSLLPLFRGPTPPDWRTAFYYHYYEYPADHHVRPHYGVITERYTLARFYWPDVDYWELFDREKDPGEMRNVLSDPAYAEVASNLMREVTRLRAELKEPEHDDPKAYGNQPK